MKKLQYGGIHRRLGFLIEHTGGYDKAYHAQKMAKELDIDVGTMRTLFKEALRSNLSHYLELLEQGVPIEKVFALVDHDNRISRAETREVFAMLGGLMSAMDSPFYNLYAMLRGGRKR